MHKKGFTLAEVLITLSIIGVVAALTIPAITASTNEARARTSVKKVVSVLNQALTLSVANGFTANSITATANATASDLANLFGTYMTTLNNETAANARFTTTDGMIYTFRLSGAAGCSNPTNNDPSTATCLVEVDINGGTTGVVANGSNYNDVYYFIIKDSEVVPANSGVVPTFGRGGGETGGIAQNALLN